MTTPESRALALNERFPLMEGTPYRRCDEIAQEWQRAATLGQVAAAVRQGNALKEPYRHQYFVALAADLEALAGGGPDA